MSPKTSKMVAAAMTVGLLASLIGAPAEARRGGSFGSRGARTYAAPRPTQVAPGYTPGLSRSMTPRSPYGQAQSGASYGSTAGQRTGSRFGFGSGLLAGVLAGGLFGSLLGHGGGYAAGGGGGGLLALLIQLAIIGGLGWLALQVFRRRRPATAGPASPFATAAPFQGSSYSTAPLAAPAPVQSDDIALTEADRNAFERLLIELQEAFGREDYARLRAITTPEVMSYLAEELGDNATHGRRNEVSGTRLVDAEVSEAWREADADYATIAMRYESVDVTRDRTTGAVLSGDPARLSPATELWTFVRSSGAWGQWKVSAIQAA